MPSFADAYNPIHKNFLFYDLIFVSIFLSEFTVRWVHAVYAHLPPPLVLLPLHSLV